MVDVRIYAEGGGEGELADVQFRQAWAGFFKAAGLQGRMPRVIRGQARGRTYDLFKKAVRNTAPDVLPLLLVDSEGAVLPNQTVWEYLKSRDGWDQPAGAGTDDAFLMVQLMETWLLADRAALRKYFGPQLNERAFAEWPELELVPKDTVLNALQKATADCKTKYAKGTVAFEVLSTVDPAEVERRCPHARQLLTRLRNV